MTHHICCRDCRFEALEDSDDEADRLVETHRGQTGHEVASERVDGMAKIVTCDHPNPLADLHGQTEIEVECGVAGDSHIACDGWSETFELAEPAEFDIESETISLPGFDWECPECGNPNEFVVEGTRVSSHV